MRDSQSDDLLVPIAHKVIRIIPFVCRGVWVNLHHYLKRELQSVCSLNPSTTRVICKSCPLKM